MAAYNYKPTKGVTMQCPVLKTDVNVGSEICMKNCKKWEVFDQKEKTISCQALSEKLKSNYKNMATNIVSNEIYELIDRLQICSEINYPDRKWSNETYYSIAWEWREKREELKKRVLELESKQLTR